MGNREYGIAKAVGREALPLFLFPIPHSLFPAPKAKKSPPKRAFLQELSLCDSGSLDFLGLQALLALGDDERDALTFLQGLEARALDRAEMHEQVITAFRRDEAKTLGVVEPLDCTALTIRHVTLPLKHGWFAAWSEMHLTARWASNPGCPGCSPAQHTPELAVPVAFRRKYLAPAQTGWPPAPGAAWPGHPLQWPHEDRLVEGQFAEGAPAAPDPVAGRRAARRGGLA